VSRVGGGGKGRGRGGGGEGWVVRSGEGEMEEGGEK